MPAPFTTAPFTIAVIAWLAALPTLAAQPTPDAQPEHAQPEQAQPAEPAAPAFANATELLDALSKRDATIETLTGDVRLTAIQALQGDTQRRLGKLALKTVRAEPGQDRRLYAVRFTQLQMDTRVQDIEEHYIFDGRWLVERHPEERQFIKREIVPAGQSLDPMDLMRDAPFWVSVGDDADRILQDYDATVHPAAHGLADNPDLAGLQRLVGDAVQLELAPKPDSPAKDDWESVRMWFDPETLLPMLYVKTEWTGDLQIAELFAVKTNEELPDTVFDTTTPEPGTGWQVQVSPWRGRADG